MNRCTRLVVLSQRPATLRCSRCLSAPLVTQRCISSTSSQSASVSPYTIPGPPPAPAKPAATYLDSRLARRRRQAELIKAGQDLRAPGGAKSKRFWKDVEVVKTDEGYTVQLSSRPLRRAAATGSSTPNSAKPVLYIPLTKPALATALALEWDTMTSTSQASKPHHVPLTSLINRALDIQDADTTDGQNTLREGIANMLMKYLETDSLLCWAPPDTLPPLPGTESLRESQIRTANAITQHLTTHIWPGIRILPVLEDENSLMPQAQPMMTQSVIRGWITGLSAFDLAGLERATLAGKSLCVGARLVAQWSEDLAARGAGQQLQAAEANRAVGTTQFGIMEASHAASLEVNSQIEKWGEVEDTHDVDREDVRRQMGSVILLVSKSSD